MVTWYFGPWTSSKQHHMLYSRIFVRIECFQNTSRAIKSVVNKEKHLDDEDERE